MSLTYGFYDSDEGDRRYDARQISKIFDGLISDGVYQNYLNGMVVKTGVEDTRPQQSIYIDTGRAWFNHTWSYNDAPYILTISDIGVPMAGNQYIAVVLEINTDSRTNSFKVIQGDQIDGTPTKPTLVKGNGIYQYPLAYIYRARSDITGIRQSDIENTVGTEECPFVTNVVTPSITIDSLMAQWTSEYAEWTEEEKGIFQTKLDELYQHTVGFENDISQQIQNWYNNLVAQINENAAVNLQNQIGTLSNLKTEKKTNLVEAINSNRFIGAKWEEGFKPIIYCGLELYSDVIARLHIPKLVNLSEISNEDGYLQPGDVLFCRVFKGENFTATTCRPKSLIVLDGNESVVSGTAKYFSKRYIRYDKTELYAIPNLNVDPPVIYNEGTSTIPSTLNKDGGFVILVYQGVINGISIFSDYVNDSYYIENKYHKAGEDDLFKSSLASIAAVQAIGGNPLNAHVFDSVFLYGKTEGGVILSLPESQLILLAIVCFLQDSTGANLGKYSSSLLRVLYFNQPPTGTGVLTSFNIVANGSATYTIESYLEMHSLILNTTAANISLSASCFVLA